MCHKTNWSQKMLQIIWLLKPPFWNSSFLLLSLLLVGVKVVFAFILDSLINIVPHLFRPKAIKGSIIRALSTRHHHHHHHDHFDLFVSNHELVLSIWQLEKSSGSSLYDSTSCWRSRHRHPHPQSTIINDSGNAILTKWVDPINKRSQCMLAIYHEVRGLRCFSKNSYDINTTGVHRLS